MDCFFRRSNRTGCAQYVSFAMAWVLSCIWVEVGYADPPPLNSCHDQYNASFVDRSKLALRPILSDNNSKNSKLGKFAIIGRSDKLPDGRGSLAAAGLEACYCASCIFGPTCTTFLAPSCDPASLQNWCGSWIAVGCPDTHHPCVNYELNELRCCPGSN